jgi:hypothetical protein
MILLKNKELNSMKYLLHLTVAILFLTSLAPDTLAVIDPEPDTIGIYFDQNADSGGSFVGANIPFTAYVILTNPTEFEIWGFEFGYEIITSGDPSAFFRLSTELPAQSIDLGDSSEILSGDYVVGMAIPLPSTAAVTLVQWTFLMTTNMFVSLEMTPSRIPSLPGDLPAYEVGGTIVPLRIGGGCFNGVAQVNESCPLASETQSFGNVKALYR